MYAVEKLSSYITRGVYTVSGPFHPFGGAVDIIVVQQQDGSFKTSPWYVRFGKFQGVLKAKEKVVSISVNGVEAGFHMYLDHKGEAYFLKEFDAEEGDSVVSPTSSGDETDEKILNGRFKNIQSCDFDAARREPISQMDVGNGKIVKRTSSRRSTIFGLMFGRKFMKDNDQGSIVERVNSLERAEIAADLLESKWSTNLPTNNRRTNNSPGTQSEGENKDTNAIDREQSPQIPSNRVSGHDDMINSHCENLDDNFWSSNASENHLEEMIKHDSPCIRVDEEVIEIYASNGNVAERTELNFDEVTPESKGPDASSQCHCTFEDSMDSHSEVLGDSFGNDMKHFEELNSHEKVVEIYTLEANTDDKSKVISELLRIESNQMDVQSPGSVTRPHDTVQSLNEICKGSTNDFSVLENDEKKTTSFSYCETIESSTLRFNVSNGRALDAVDLFSGGGTQGEETSEVQCDTSERIPAVKSQQESGACTSNENLSGCHDQNMVISRVEVSSVSQNNQSDCPNNADSPPTMASFRTLNGLHSSPDGVFEVEETSINQIDYSGNETQMEDGETTDCIQVQRLDSADQVKELENSGKGVSVNESCNSNGVNNTQECSVAFRSVEETIASALSPEGSEDDQFPFTDTDSFTAKEIGPELSLDDTAVETEDHQMVTAEADVKELELKDIENEQLFEGFCDVSRPHTSPITIRGSWTNESGNEQLVRSLPNIRSDIHDLEGSNLLHPLSCSLNSKSTNNVLDLLEKKCPHSLKADSQHSGEQGQVTPEFVATDIDVENKGEQKGTVISPAVELSLCKHLLFEGMGADAACQVFNSEKVNLEKFCALGPSLVKNDKLVIKIGNHYYPWDAAAPIILGMVSFGQEQIFKTQGMIPVDRDEKNIKGDNSRAIVPTGVSWRIWPFNFKRSRTISTIHAAREGFNETDRDSAFEKTKSLTAENDMLKVRSMKKKVRSLTPTSEQLSSLNLKEGRNVITFSFSTAMLGAQQVDASIYLWKWNTRIVISDVDGTITKSDVLGQFMPLVGVDWSQTGVAHLFSAIKDGGCPGHFILFLRENGTRMMLGLQNLSIWREKKKNERKKGRNDEEKEKVKGKKKKKNERKKGKEKEKEGKKKERKEKEEEKEKIKKGWEKKKRKRKGKKEMDRGESGNMGTRHEATFRACSGCVFKLFQEYTLYGCWWEEVSRDQKDYHLDEEIRALFPPDCNPFYAGFGNRDTDEISYLKVGIPIGKIFIINPKGEVTVNRRVDTRSYTSLHALVNGMFPPMSSAEQLPTLGSKPEEQHQAILQHNIATATQQRK
ncbi:phosphatidate phosphatase PAH2 [Cocos nucifera]|uniref:phosphatidate phosphatase n=1 Tax=Cocos nucifera TaxID=13894 RepID=A0A8K0I324_COCNU|nr:phosphatidate phosphatase PAH2 [Cocos nucifera]